LDTIEEIQAESQKVLNTDKKKNISRKRSKNGDGGTGVYMREGTTSRMMAADRTCGEFYYFYSVSPEYFGHHHVNIPHAPTLKNSHISLQRS
jgi:hypothetical protein